MSSTLTRTRNTTDDYLYRKSSALFFYTGHQCGHQRLKIVENCRQFQVAYWLSALPTWFTKCAKSYEVACVTADMIPVDVLVVKARRLYEKQEASLSKPTKRMRSLAAWQTVWDQAKNCWWTYRLIPNIRMWTTRNHGETSYDFTQLLSRHGGYWGWVWMNRQIFLHVKTMHNMFSSSAQDSNA